MTDKAFVKLIWEYYETHKRDLPWRNTYDPYAILVSEMMLQQTQVSRVLVKYAEFMTAFPNWKALHAASTSDVLKVWKGLGYNRRAFFLKRIAQAVMEMHGGNFPTAYEDTLTLPGIGQSTAGALQAFAFNAKQPFIETNIRAVLLHFFFASDNPDMKVSDREVHAKLVDILKHVSDDEARDWYYALYDYGTMLKQSLGAKKKTLHAKSKQYKKQSKFEGSNRQLRAIILDFILRNAPVSATKIDRHIKKQIADATIPFTYSKETAELIGTLLKQLEDEKHAENSKKGWRIVD